LQLRSQLQMPGGERLVMGFDFPIGLPRAYARRVGVSRFLDVLPAFGRDAWSEFFDVADVGDEISIHRASNSVGSNAPEKVLSRCVWILYSNMGDSFR
jgi:hypothetical protein